MSLVPLSRQPSLPEDKPVVQDLPHPLSFWYYSIEGPGAYPSAVSAEVREQAVEALRAMEPVLAPITERQLQEWLLPIPASVRNGGKSVEEIKAWFAAVCLACDGLPASLFNRRSQADALRTFQFFPSAADIYTLLSEDKSKLTVRAFILGTILQCATEQPARIGTTP